MNLASLRVSLVVSAITLCFFASPSDAKSSFVCPEGRLDYGSGMLAHFLPDAVKKKVLALSQCLREHNKDLVLSKRTTDPSSPHVSVLYGVRRDDMEPVRRELEQRWPAHKKNALTFGTTMYWDDAKRQKSVCVVRVIDNSSALVALHDALSRERDGEQSHAFTPHVTLAHLPLGARLSFDACQSQLVALSATVWRACEFVVTDRCGAPMYHRACP